MESFGKHRVTDRINFEILGLMLIPTLWRYIPYPGLNFFLKY